MAMHHPFHCAGREEQSQDEVWSSLSHLIRRSQRIEKVTKEYNTVEHRRRGLP
jgi:hypothetical protein